MKKIILSVLLLLSATISLSAIEKTPPSFDYFNDLTSITSVYNAPVNIDKQLLREQDMERIKDGQPLRFAVGIPANIELSPNSPRLTLPNGEKIWQQVIKSEDADGLILTFDELYIPEGGKLYLYTKDREQSILYTHETNPSGSVYASETLYQDEIVLEYIESEVSDQMPRLKVSDIGYVYRSASETNVDLSCYININCAEGNNWQMQKNGVVQLEISLIENGRRNWYICSGSLINNTRQDGTPYILTANHCIENYDDRTMSTMKFNFFMEDLSTNCFSTQMSSPNTQTLTGAELIADIPYEGGSDGTLLKMTSSIPEYWNVYYNGWDARGIVPQSGVCIHHPYGFVKKISTYNTPPTITGDFDLGYYYPQYTAENAYWEVSWSRTVNGKSVTYQGSSGSPLFNENGHIIGTLTAGDSECGYEAGTDLYGMLSYHWNKHEDASQHFKQFLDPDNTGALFLDGFAPRTIDAPIADNATDIDLSGFTAHWSKVDDASGYLLDVYEMGYNEKIYVDGFESRQVGDVTSYEINNLNSYTEYYYTVRATIESVTSAYSNEIKVYTEYIETSLDKNKDNAPQIFINNESIIIQLRENISTEVSLYNSTGQLLYQLNHAGTEIRIPSVNLTKGIYLIKINNESYKILKP